MHAPRGWGLIVRLFREGVEDPMKSSNAHWTSLVKTLDDWTILAVSCMVS